MVATGYLLNVNKPKGVTSHDVVAQVRRLTGERRVGHAGTLDPLATGVLVIYVGKATRLVEYLLDARKVYEAEITFGVSTDTYDAEGAVVARVDPVELSLSKVEEGLSAFVGQIEQTPPAYSAVKLNGVPAYRSARQGLALNLPARPVQIYNIELISWRCPVARVLVECGRGVYIRSLAHDLGQRLGLGAYLSNLVRLAVGPFTIAEASPLAALAQAAEEGRLDRLAYAMDTALLHLPAAILGPSSVAALRQGQPWPGQAWDAAESLCRAYSDGGELVAVMHWERDAHAWWPRKVLV